eukprot:5169857-Prymnesium_polylepis.1
MPNRKIALLGRAPKRYSISSRKGGNGVRPAAGAAGGPRRRRIFFAVSAVSHVPATFCTPWQLSGSAA